MDAGGEQDSPLSISSNIIGILTFVVAITAAAYARFTYLRNSHAEYLRVKTSLSWYKTESTWLAALLAARRDEPPGDGSSAIDVADSDGRRRRAFDEPLNEGWATPEHKSTQYQMYAFVMDDLLNLEQRLLDVVTEIEVKTSIGGLKEVGSEWSLLPQALRGGRPSVAVAWLSVRTKALELVRQREALTTRVQFLQMSIMASRARSWEDGARRREVRASQAEARLESLLMDQHDEIQQLKTLIRDRLGMTGGGERRTAAMNGGAEKRG